MFGFFDYDRLAYKSTQMGEMYRCANPFPHIVLDDAGSSYMMQKAEWGFKDSGEKWHEYDNHFEKKLAFDAYGKMPPMIQCLVSEMQASPFVSFLEELTGLRGLIPDPGLRGAGMHRIKRGGKLDVHADFNWHPKLHLVRAVNVLIYLNSGWIEEWGGHLELWDREITKCEKRISPRFNRMVIFNSTDDSYHGHPEPLNCPESESRKSLAMYYYRSPVETKPDAHSTMFKKLPGAATTAEIEQFREKRSKFQTYHSEK